MRRLREIQLALMLLTRLPAGYIPGEAPALAAARWAFPLVGLFAGLIGWSVFSLAGAGPVAAVLSIAALALLTGALHFDGLADFADGMGGGRDRDHALEIMRDSRLGSYGAVALGLVILLWAMALAELGSWAGLMQFLAIGALSRAAMVLLQETLPPARTDGLGHSASGRTRGGMAAVILTVLAVLLCPNGVLLLGSCLLVALAVGAAARRKLGGLTGDVLGATQLLAETACWVALSLV